MKRAAVVLNLVAAGAIGLWCMLPFILNRMGGAVCDPENSAVIGGKAGATVIFVSPHAGITVELITVFTAALLLFNAHVIHKDIKPKSERP